jgi:hypothetical protein
VNRAVSRAFLYGLDTEEVRAVFGEEWMITHLATGWLAMRHGGGVVFSDGPESLLRPALFAGPLVIWHSRC